MQSQNTLSKKIHFYSFDNAMVFLSLANTYIKDNNIKAKMSNVYNTVNVEISENFLNQITENEYKTALYFNNISKFDYINDLVEKDYTTVRASNCERDTNNLLPTGNIY
jgi:pterin-4a-carbinolamine dehydratase